MKKSKINENEFDFYKNVENEGKVEEIVFMKMPKILFFGEKYEKVTTSAKMLYMLLLDRTYLSMKNNLTDEENRVYIFYTQTEAMKVLQFGSCKINQLYKELENNELIFRKRQGLNKADIIYVKNLSKLEVTETGYNDEYKSAYTIPCSSSSPKKIINTKNVESVENFQHNQKTTFLTYEQNNSKVMDNETVEFQKTKVHDKAETKNYVENHKNVESVENFQHNHKTTVLAYEQNNSKVMENETIEFQKTKVHDKAETKNYVENHKNVENFEENETTTVLTYKKNKSGFIESISQELPKPQTNNNKLNNNKINNNKSIISSSEVENLNLKNPNIKDDDDDINILTIKHLNSTTTTKSIIEELIPTNAVKDKNLKDLFVNSLTSILTSKKYQKNKKETYNKLFNLKNKDKVLLKDVARQSIKDFVNGNTNTNIIYPISYMCSCILNVLDYGIIETDTFAKAINSAVSNAGETTIDTTIDNLGDITRNNTSYDIAYAEELLNTVPRLV